MAFFKFSPTQRTTKGKFQPDDLDYDGLPVTPSDSVDLLNGIAVGVIAVTTGGNIAVNLAGGGTATLTGLTAGQIYLINVTRVLATGTTATGIYALY